MELVSHLPFLSLTSHIISRSFKGHSEFILLYILPVLDKYHLINLTHEPLRVTSSWLAPQIIIDPRTVSCRYWGNTSTRTSDMGKNTFIIVCAVHVRYGFQQELNLAFFCTTYFEDINNNLLMVCRGPVNIKMLLSFTLCMFTAIQFVAAVYSRDINVSLHHTETKQVQIMTWFSWPWRNLHFNKLKKENVI